MKVPKKVVSDENNSSAVNAGTALDADGADGDKKSRAKKELNELGVYPFSKTIASKIMTALEINEWLRCKLSLIQDEELYRLVIRVASRGKSANMVNLEHAAMPSWWKKSVHDPALVQGMLVHGLLSWQAIANDPSLPFYHFLKLAFEQSEEPGVADGDDSVVVKEEVAPMDLEEEDAAPMEVVKEEAVPMDVEK